MRKILAPYSKNIFNNNRGFTLIELLVVISIISILAGVMLMVINPATQQKKAREAVLKSKTSQLCLALNACGAAEDDATKCDTFSKIGATDPTGDPVGAAYIITSSPNPTTAISNITITGTFGACIYECNYNFNDGAIGNFKKRATATCL